MIKQFLQKQLNKLGYEIIKRKQQEQWPADFENDHREIIQKVAEFTMTSPERLFGLIEAVKYVSKNKIEGDIVECGVWKGGSMLSIAHVLMQMNDISRDLYLYDTFEGMSAPSEVDVSYTNEKAEELLRTNEKNEENIFWAYST